MCQILKIEKCIDELGDELICCNEKCDGINNSNIDGIIPRCLYFEINRDEDIEKGCIVVGINPGISKNDEKNYYKKHAPINYNNVKNYSKKIIEGYEKKSAHPYYKSIKDFLEKVRLTGPILWTELVKCENSPKTKPSIQTFRICTDKYLSKELKCVPEYWPIVAVGNKAYTALSYLYPHKTVIGIPHPTGSYGYFNKLIKQNNYIDDVNDAIEKKKAMWLNYKNYE